MGLGGCKEKRVVFLTEDSVALQAEAPTKHVQVPEITPHPWLPNCRWRKLAACDFAALGGSLANHPRALANFPVIIRFPALENVP